MSISQEIFALRKAKQLDEAYQLVNELIAQGTDDEWEIKACAWCLIDLIKQEAQVPNSTLLPNFRQQLSTLKIDPNDEILKKQLDSLQSLSSPFGQDVLRANTLARENRYLESLEIYRKIFNHHTINDQHIHMSYGWTLYNYAKDLWAIDPQQQTHTRTIKHLLNEYLQLNTEKPSILHSCILSLASKLAKKKLLRITPFFHMWGDHFRLEDYQAYENKDMNTYSPFAESILQMVAKETVYDNDLKWLNFILPRLEQGVEKFKDNIWLKYYLAKTFLALGRHQEAKVFCVNVCKVKQSECWAWGLLAEVYADYDNNMALACYCKALLCKNEEKLKMNLHKKLAQMLVIQNRYAEAKFEILATLKNNNIAQIELKQLTQQEWYRNTDIIPDNQAFYRQHAVYVDNLIYENLPWLNANMGDKFIVMDTQKTKYKIFVKTEQDTIEASVSEHQIKNLEFKIGQSLQVKGEFDEKNIFRIYLIDHRIMGKLWDSLSLHLAVVDSINREKNFFHFIVDKTKHGIIYFEDINEDINKKIQQGDVLEIATAKSISKSGTRLRVINFQPSTQMISNETLKNFKNEIIETTGNIGFTSSEYFIPPYLILEHQLISGNRISGQAVLNFNNKKKKWGWKVLKINEKFLPKSYDDFGCDEK